MPVRRVKEASVKKMVTGYLLSLQQPDSGTRCYFRMPVPYGYGRGGLDYEGCIEGRFFAIETKAPEADADLSPRQRFIAKSIIDAGGKVFVISCGEGLAAFRQWVSKCKSVSAEHAVAA